MIYDYMVIGQGLAGTTLSYQLIKSGKSVLVIDQLNEHSASRVAAGLFNPLTGPKMVKTWKVEELFAYLKSFYEEMEIFLGESFLVMKSIYRPFNDRSNQNDWQGKIMDDRYLPFISEICEEGRYSSIVYDEFGGLILKNTGYVRVSKLISSYRRFLQKEGLLLNKHFEESHFAILKNGILEFNGCKARKLVDCRGFRTKQDNLFGWLPLVPVKGEILTITLEKEIQTLFNKGCFIIPERNGTALVGSNYDRHDLSEEITEKAKKEIITKLESLLKLGYNITGQMAGIRPGTVARRPLLGIYPKLSNIAVFNGLGTKGVSLAPYFSYQLMRKLENGDKLDAEVDIRRYYSLYFESHFGN